ncbi:MAG: copper chaperone PCu(A)C [Pseudomonadota bacterium]|nr:copper chaperone PCu(A)C [Pseudomonadota bacterium]
MKRRLLAALLLAAAPAGAQARKGEIVVERPVMRASLGQAPNTAAYVVIRNTGSAPVRLLGASCACARRVEIHRHEMRGGVMRMRAVAALTVPAGGRLALKPGHGHALMVMGLKKPVENGTKVELRLRFQRAGEIRVPFLATRDVERALTGRGQGSPGAHAH